MAFAFGGAGEMLLRMRGCGLSSPAELAEAFRLLVASEVTVDGLITHRVPLAGLAEGVELMRGRRAVKVYVTP